MSTKAVTERQKSTEVVISAGEVNASAIEDAFKARYHEHLRKGESMPSISTLVHLLLRRLQASTEHLVAADETHEAELRDDVEPRKLRDAASQALRTRIVEVRGGLEGIYGAATAREAGFIGETPYDPVLLSRLAQTSIKALPRLKLPKPRLDVGPPDLTKLAAELKKLDDELNKHLKTVKREEGEAAVTLLAKTQAMTEHDTDFAAAASLLEGLLIVAGKPELADRVRPPKREKPGAAVEEGSGGTVEGGDGTVKVEGGGR